MNQEARDELERKTESDKLNALTMEARTAMFGSADTADVHNDYPNLELARKEAREEARQQ